MPYIMITMSHSWVESARTFLEKFKQSFSSHFHYRLSTFGRASYIDKSFDLLVRITS